MPQIAFVTGAAAGIGAEVARQLAAQDHRVVISARDPDKAAKTAAELGVEALDVGVDVTDQASVDRAAEVVDRTCGEFETRRGVVADL